ncbi:hypothetical protein AGABI2DRAFT_123075 [Agaricus bisporus var. bisporus H97]|uniref:hypothetical protein n=1 Tax=Agaricus bisporus var. bisporus (strain H97 / ATCC MYA-4626 / FGSC 10389) TaxID=936046 RepID=UPI00029F5D75|nr:hypothetical protein AGABI2DRAFT_123075 [Agaricus bisporus var. bisporus H97]EKV41953.1 hypothetical protein AGABI2DRAFT_123075 [Agaricus bisporus var. bisporus H97]
MPPEIVVEIFKQLHWKDLLAARQTCSVFYTISKSRDIWENLIQTHAAATHGPPTTLEKPMYMYSACKLEEHFLRGARNESKWLDNIPFEERSIPSPHKFRHCHLLRGGRWFICSATGGEVLYCDLESPGFGLVPLIPYPFPYPCDSITSMAIEEDNEAEILSFNIALVHVLEEDWLYRSSGETAVTGDSRVDVWFGKVVLGEDGNGTHLHAEKLASVPLPVYLGKPILGASLRGSLLAFTVEWESLDGFGTQCDAIILDWKAPPRTKHQLCIRKTVHFSITWASGVKTELMLLPGDHLLTVIRSMIRIYDHSLVPWASERRHWREALSLSEQCAHVINILPPFGPVPRDFSPIFSLSGDRYRVVFNCFRGIRGLTLQYKDGGLFKATLVDLLEWPRTIDAFIEDRQSHFLYNYGVTLGSYDSLFRSHFTWPDEEGSSPNRLSAITGNLSCLPAVMNMDVNTGRVLWISNRGELKEASFTA